jgi:tRNA G18 (ribose-2'-O)-methylase SpoU
VVVAVERADDPRISAYQHVGDPQWLRARGLFVAEGRLVVRRLLEAKRFALRSILLTPAALQSFGGSIAADGPVFVAPQQILSEVTGFNFHRGCLAIAVRPSADASSAARDPFVKARLLLAVEGVGNPDNVGGLFRVAAAFGVGGVLLDPSSGDPLYRKAVRTSMGAVLDVPYERLTRWPAALEALRAQGFTIIGLTPRADARIISDIVARPEGGSIVMVGSEGTGLTDAALAQADTLVRIPIAPSVDSLNVTVACGVALAYFSGLIGTVR